MRPIRGADLFLMSVVGVALVGSCRGAGNGAGQAHGSGGKRGGPGGLAGGPATGSGGVSSTGGSPPGSGGGGMGASGGSSANGGSPGDGTGAGGSVVVPAGTCRGVEVTGDLVPAQPPVVLAATLRSSGGPNDFSLISIAPTAKESAFVAFRSSELLVEVGPIGVSTVPTAVCGDTLQLFVDESDAPRLFATTEKVVSDRQVDNFFSFWRPGAPAWSAEFIAGGQGFDDGGDGIFMGSRAYAAALGSGGRAHALALHYLSNSPQELTLFDRSADGTWTLTGHFDNNAPAAMAVDSLGRTRVVYSNSNSHKSDYYDYREWIDGAVSADFREDGPIAPSALRLVVAPGLSGTLGIARFTRDNLVFTASDGANVGDDQLLPNTRPAEFGAAPCYAQLEYCKPVVCEVDFVRPEGMALAATADGTFWVAYQHYHGRNEYTTEGGSTLDCWKLSASSETNDLVLVRLSADGSSPPSVRWTYPMMNSKITLVARGSRLYLGFFDSAANAARVFVLDSTKL